MAWWQWVLVIACGIVVAKAVVAVWTIAFVSFIGWMEQPLTPEQRDAEIRRKRGF